MASKLPRQNTTLVLAIIFMATQALGASSEALGKHKRAWTKEDLRKNNERFFKVLGGLAAFFFFLFVFGLNIQSLKRLCGSCSRRKGPKPAARDAEAAREGEDSTSTDKNKPAN